MGIEDNKESSIEEGGGGANDPHFLFLPPVLVIHGLMVILEERERARDRA